MKGRQPASRYPAMTLYPDPKHRKSDPVRCYETPLFLRPQRLKWLALRNAFSPESPALFHQKIGLDIDSIDSILTHRFEERSVEISRVSLDCYFRVRYQIEVFPYPYQDILQLLRAEKRRSPASNVDRVKGIESRTVHLHLFEESIQKIRNGRDGC